MMDEFDPYHSWLGIPPRHQPPNHYRLLGVQAFESDADVISNAADRQMGHVRTYQTGKHEAASQKILNELAAAKVCLLNPQKKASYDEQLRGGQQQQQRQRRAPEVQTPVIVTAAASPSAARPSRGSASRRANNRSKKPLWKHPLAVAVACSLVPVSIIVVVIISTRAAPKPRRQEVARHEASQPETNRQEANRQEANQRETNRRKTKTTIEPDNQPAIRETGRGTSPAQDHQRKTGVTAPVAPNLPDREVLVRPGASGPIRVRPADPQPPVTERKEPDPPPVKIPAVKPDSQVPPLAKKTPPQKAPLPNADAIRAAETEIAELFGLDKPAAAAAKRKMASEILQAAADEEQRTPAHFAILRTAGDVAASAGDLALAMDAIEQIEAVYDVDVWELKLTAAQRASKSTVPANERKQLIDAIASLVDPAIAADRYQIATSLAAVATSVARKTRDRELIRQAAAVSAAAKKRQQEFDTKIAPALAALKANVDDPNANLVVGKYYCLGKGDWARGLPMLEKCSDPVLKSAAQLDLRKPAESAERAKVGDAWYAAGKSDKSLENFFSRAHHWYTLALAKSGGLAKLKIEARIKETAKIAQGAPKPAKGGSGVRRTGPKFGDKNVIAKLRSTVKEREANPDSIRRVVFSPDGTSLAVEHYAWIRIYDADTLKMRMEIGRNGRDYMGAIAYSPDGSVLATGSGKGSVNLWDPVTGKKRQTLTSHSRPLLGLTFSANGKLMAACGWGSGDVKLWDTSTWKERITIKAPTSTLQPMALSIDGSRLAVAGDDGSIRFWNAKTGQQAGVIQAHSRAISYVAYSPDGKTLASASADRTTRIWDAKTGQAMGTLSGHTHAVVALAFTSDSKMLASTSFDHSIILWDAAGRIQQRIEMPRLNKSSYGAISVAFSRDGRLMAAIDHDTLRVWVAARR